MVEISQDGRFLFTINTASSSISRYAIADDGSLELVGSTASKNAGSGPLDARLDPDGDTLWVVEGGAHAVGGFAVDGASLASCPPRPLRSRRALRPSASW